MSNEGEKSEAIQNIRFGRGRVAFRFGGRMEIWDTLAARGRKVVFPFGEQKPWRLQFSPDGTTTRAPSR
jgi:hypothetical protein